MYQSSGPTLIFCAARTGVTYATSCARGTLPDLDGLQVELDDLPSVHVDLLTPHGLPPRFSDQALAEAQPARVQTVFLTASIICSRPQQMHVASL